MKGLRGYVSAFMIGVMGVWLAAPIQAAPPTIVVSIKSIDELLDDANYLGEAVGHEGLRSIAESAINSATGGSGLAGVDQEKPLGVYWNMTAAAKDDIGKTVVFLPISDVDAFKKLISMFAPDFKETDGLWTMTAGPMPIFAKMSGDYCFVCSSKEGLASLSDPAKLVNSKYDISIDVNVAAIPKDAKAQFLKMTEDQGRAGMANGPEPKSEAEKVGQQIGFDGALAALTAVTNDGDHITLGLDINSETHMTSLDLGLTSKSNSALAKTLSVYNKTTPAFAAIGSDEAPLRLVLSHPTPWTAETSKKMFDAMRKSAEASIDEDNKLDGASEKKAAKDVCKRLFNIIQATTDSGSVHSVVLLEEGDEETVRVIGGLKLAKGDEAGKLLDDIVKLAKESPDFAKVKLDAAKHAGARIHSIDPESDETTKMFGEGPGHLAIRTDSLWFALGGGNLDALKSALDQSGKKPSKAVAPISLKMKPATIVTLMEENDAGLIERAEAIAGEDGDVFNIEVVPDGTNGVKIRLEFGVDLLKLGAR